MRRLQAVSRCAAPDSTVYRHRAAGEPAAPLAQVGEAHDRIDQVVVGGELERVDAGVAKAARSAASRRLRRLRRSAGGSARSWVSTNSCSPVSASCIDDQAEVGQLHLERIVQPHRDHLVALREQCRAARAQPAR